MSAILINSTRTMVKVIPKLKFGKRDNGNLLRIFFIICVVELNFHGSKLVLFDMVFVYVCVDCCSLWIVCCGLFVVDCL